MNNQLTPATVDNRSTSPTPRRFSRRDWLLGAVALGGVAGTAKLLWDDLEQMQRAAVVVARATAYDASLVDVMERGLSELGVGRQLIHGKTVLLKPNLVEPSAQAPHINTHPEVVRAAAELFRRWDARDVFVAEGQGHCRDTYFVLEQSGLEPILNEDHLEFVDLNHDDVYKAHNQGGWTRLGHLYLPQTLQRAEIIVSLPKLKTHHWAGVTLSMKNLFGVMPGICYGWPKNVLHYAGIGKAIVDINATVRPHLAIVDGIVGMEGDGPIMGTPKRAGVLVMGTNLPAVDATAARLMGFDPFRLEFLKYASGRLGPIQERHIEQRGEPLAALAQRFALPDHPHFRQFR
ncbi:MAG: DUF362 domain-containing protein [Planctomycetaceae bacterium]